jgi:hypothetical protein
MRRSAVEHDRESVPVPLVARIDPLILGQLDVADTGAPFDLDAPVTFDRTVREKLTESVTIFRAILLGTDRGWFSRSAPVPFGCQGAWPRRDTAPRRDVELIRQRDEEAKRHAQGEG